jgi:hypothetical protein
MVNAKPMGAAEPTGGAKPTGAASEDSGSLYQPGNEDMEQEAVDKVHAFVFNMQNLCPVCKIIYHVLISCVQEAMLDLEPELSNNVPNNVSKNIKGSRTKRVTAIPEGQSQPARITRKRARDLCEPAEVCHVQATDPQDGSIDQELIISNAHTQFDNQNMTHQGKIFYFLSP